ncbi:hypothetical protein E5163_13530 [Marinicauda algicola]|uniref:Lipoprotein n=1 Tax=Marinicauda algicola TaxID=2029849 RepID=A0A4S2GXQ1_9PROT|nr:hypothetical protein [Marinicauda algicola]TGY87927.1 hypothetical protein E5163_13530 [Marinicauda algicola]
MKRASLLLAALFLTGCVVPPPHADPYDPYDPYYGARYAPHPAEESADTAQQICSIDSLTEARNEMRSEIERAGYDRGYYYGPDYDSRERARIETRESVSERPYGPQTETVELVHAFAADLDAAYRFATSSCQAYQMCMQNQGYEEAACMSTAQQWQDARRDFTALSGRLAEIRLAITQTCHGCVRVPAPHHRPHYRDPHCRDGYCEPDYCEGDYCDGYYEEDCDDVLGDVFTTSPCRYEPRRYRRY